MKGRAQPLGLYDQQICKYHHPIVYPLAYLGDEPVMAITIDPIPVSPSKITSASPSLVAVSIDEPKQVPNEEAELKSWLHQVTQTWTKSLNLAAYARS